MKRDLNSTYKEKQAVIASKVIETALSYLPVAEAASSLVAELDVLNAFANVAATSANPYTRPKILPLGSGTLRLKVTRMA
jgi:DNA mismatch repair ATPase MutS